MPSGRRPFILSRTSAGVGGTWVSYQRFTVPSTTARSADPKSLPVIPRPGGVTTVRFFISVACAGSVPTYLMSIISRLRNRSPAALGSDHRLEDQNSGSLTGAIWQGWQIVL